MYERGKVEGGNVSENTRITAFPYPPPSFCPLTDLEGTDTH